MTDGPKEVPPQKDSTIPEVPVSGPVLPESLPHIQQDVPIPAPSGGYSPEAVFARYPNMPNVEAFSPIREYSFQPEQMEENRVDPTPEVPETLTHQVREFSFPHPEDRPLPQVGGAQGHTSHVPQTYSPEVHMAASPEVFLPPPIRTPDLPTVLHPQEGPPEALGAPEVPGPAPYTPFGEFGRPGQFGGPEKESKEMISLLRQLVEQGRQNPDPRNPSPIPRQYPLQHRPFPV